MTGMTAKRNSVSGPKTANSCGLTLSAAIRRVMTAGDNPQAAIPETVIIGDRGLAIQGANFAQIPASELFTLYNNTLNITQTDVMLIITRIIKVDGLEAARVAFKQMNDFFSGMKGWAETTDAVYDLFAEKRKEEKQQQREEKLEELRTAAPTISVTSEAKAVGKAEVEHMDVDVKSPGNNIARIINIGDNKDED